jgi:hypothetical protein
MTWDVNAPKNYKKKKKTCNNHVLNVVCSLKSIFFFKLQFVTWLTSVIWLGIKYNLTYIGTTTVGRR